MTARRCAVTKSDEREIAGSAAVTGTPRKDVRLSGEVLVINCNRSLRVTIGQPAHAPEVQAQLALRISF